MNVRGFLAIPVLPNKDKPGTEDPEWEEGGVPRFTRRYPVATSGPVIVIELDIELPDAGLNAPVVTVDVPAEAIKIQAAVTHEEALDAD